MRIRESANERYEIVSIDDFLKMSADETIYEDDVFEINGELCERVAEAWKTASGVIVDHVITSKRIFDGFRTACGNTLLLKILLSCPVEVLQEREQRRGNRRQGSAEASLTYLYPKEGYDLTVDTNAMTVEECAACICKKMSRQTCCMRKNSSCSADRK